jgi:hypothetical protein
MAPRGAGTGWDARVLCYSPTPVSQQRVRQHYAAWRQAQNLPIRCDEPGCCFHTTELTWNGKPLKPILDHVNGNRRDNRPGNLRYLCPNCDSQQATRGGLNRGRVVDAGDRKYTLRDRETGRLDFHFLPDGASLSLGEEPK